MRLTNIKISVSIAEANGGIPEWPKGADCKSVVSDFGGSNPPSPTRTRNACNQYGCGRSLLRINAREVFHERLQYVYVKHLLTMDDLSEAKIMTNRLLVMGDIGGKE